MTEIAAEESALEERPRLLAEGLGPVAVGLAALISALWGTNPVALKVALRTLPPIGSAGMRFLIAAAGVWVWCGVVRVKRWPRRGEVVWLVGAALFFIAQIATFTLGVHWGTAGHSVVLLHMYPFFVVGMAHFLIPGERATAGRVVGLVAAFCGVAALFGAEWGRWEGTELLGDVVQVGSAFLLAAQVVYLKHAVARIEPARVVLWQMVVGAGVFLGYSFGFEGLGVARPSWESAGAVVYQGVVIGALCFTVWTWLLRRHAAGRVAVFGFVAPLVGVLLSAAALGEPLNAALLVSAGLVAAGIVMANLW